VAGVYDCSQCGGVFVLTVPRGPFFGHLFRAMPRAVIAAAVVTGIAATVRLSVSQEMLVYTALGIMGLVLIVMLLRRPLVWLLSLPTRKYARTAPPFPIVRCGACGTERALEMGSSIATRPAPPVE
jgi:hypothetical protein